ncbi:MAG: hypothetical protein ABH986_04070 [archaeon]
MKILRLKKKSPLKRRGPVKRFFAGLSKKGRVLNRKERFFRRIRERLSKDLVKFISMEKGPERKKFRDKLNDIIKAELIEQLNLSASLGLSEKIIDGEVRIKPKDKAKTISELQGKLKEVLDAKKFLTQEIGALPRETPNYDLEYNKLQELNHLLLTLILPPQFTLEIALKKLKGN